MGETSKWTAQREMTLIEDMNCSFKRLIEKGNNLTAERDRYKAEAMAWKRRCEAAEELWHECRGCDKQSPLTCNECVYWKAWQLIKYPSIKEAGE